ncbi:MAG: putative cysteine desulfurase [Firmicutes bacterium ADurb.Bin419]|nr:MAG: putative cysteine desulfurase [Firmicutes bacterium ADurb.Bin419]
MIYLNNAATSYPKPQCVIDSVNRCINRVPVDSKRSAFDTGEKDIVTSCREKLSTLFNVSNINEISFSSGATHSANIVTRGLDLANAHVITTVTEHSSVLRALKVEERERNVKLSIVGCDKDGFVSVDDIRREINNETKAIFINHSSNVLGTEADLYAISELAHDENLILVVDASQSAGVIPLDIKSLDLDVVVFTGHKSLYGISGIGGLYTKGDLYIKPLIVGGTGVKSTSLYQTEDRPVYFEAGTQNSVGIASLEAGVSFVLENGIDKLNENKSKLFYKIIDEFSKIPEIIIYGNKEYYTPIISFNIDKIDPKEVGYYLGKKYEIAVRTGILCAPLIHEYINSNPLGTVRVSLSYFTTDKEVNYFIEAVKEIVSISKKDKKELQFDKSNLSCV